MSAARAAPPVTHIHLVLNWLDEVKARLAGTTSP